MIGTTEFMILTENSGKSIADSAAKDQKDSEDVDELLVPFFPSVIVAVIGDKSTLFFAVAVKQKQQIPTVVLISLGTLDTHGRIN